jgi:hypothetical protein
MKAITSVILLFALLFTVFVAVDALYKGEKVCTKKSCCGVGGLAFQKAPTHAKDADCGIAALKYCGGKNKCCNKMLFGVDSNDPNLVNNVGAMKKSGVNFVVRYVSNLTPALTSREAVGYRKAKMPLVAVWELGRTRAIEGGSKKKNFANGVADARQARKVMASLGANKKPVYFAVDVFVNPKNYKNLRADIKIRSVNAVIPYFMGLRKIMTPKRMGAYGPYTLIKGLFDKKMIKWGWQASTFDSKSNLDPRAQLYQCNCYPPNLFGVGQIDYDLALRKDFGQFK